MKTLLIHFVKKGPWNGDALSKAENCIFYTSFLFTVYNFIANDIQKPTGKTVHINICILIRFLDSEYSVFVLPAYRPNFAEFGGTTYTVEQAWYTANCSVVIFTE